MLLCAPAAPAQTAELELNGRRSVRVLMGDPLAVTVRGGANLPVALGIDVSPGPTPLFGRSLPLGFTQAFAVVPLGFTGASGERNVSLLVPASPSYHGLDLFFLAVVADPSAPLGLDFSNGADLTLLDRNVDLAGSSPPSYPFFAHVAAFNAGSTVQLGIDPTRYPAIVGKTADVYVVASKTRSQWIADPSLVDVAGGPRTTTFSGSTIQANTITLDNGTLSGSTGAAGLGVGYDVVIDFNRNGQFDGTDLADGYDENEAGFYIVHDLTAPGPHQVVSTRYDLGGTFRKQEVFFPANIAQLGALPLVVIAHGNGHVYTWYDHLGRHLASYGYVVMSHENNTLPGSQTAAESTLGNTDDFLGSLPLIAGGALVGHVDSGSIIWIGHSRGGEGVVRAYDLLVDGAAAVQNFSRSDIALVQSLAPTDFGGSSASDPHDVSFSLVVAAADSDVNGCAVHPFTQPFKLHDRADGRRMSLTMYGVGHGDLHNHLEAFPFVEGPCQIGRAKAHLILKSYVLALLEHVVRGNVPAKDYLWRPYEVFRPIGVPFEPCVVAHAMYQEAEAQGRRSLDDFQTNPSPALASSGAAVTHTVPSYAEGLLDDANLEFTHDPADPFNGFLMGASNDPGFGTRFSGDVSRGCVFDVDGSGDYHLTYGLPPAASDLRDFEYLQLRAAQGTRHPLTVAELAGVTFSVRLTDGAGHSSTIHIGALGAAVDEPYQRSILCQPPLCVNVVTCGAGVGWNNEMETVRLRLADFQNNGTDLDLADIRQVAFLFGPSHGTAVARIGLDEVELARR